MIRITVSLVLVKLLIDFVQYVKHSWKKKINHIALEKMVKEYVVIVLWLIIVIFVQKKYMVYHSLQKNKVKFAWAVTMSISVVNIKFVLYKL